ncbi:helix-turn-helix domain-containing protein [Streptomyces sp. NBC_00249]|uniref:helix-turn-helix transcriptional regulator n=1 Tax=Streptomyces sp. NBC_00249 TaxID=2975690 RepID=UPI002253D55F|nr:helix-turn-helix transcriptional regulator [Streptomyces sp. NBC_00249]MCX5196878.1 helix-turn-helix domain-containing protein [Streptomyces sp. NBC_00249]
MAGIETGAETIGLLLRRLRKEDGRTQQELAESLSVRRGHPLEQAAVSRWENEERLPDPVSRALLAEEFGVPELELKRAVQLARRLRRQHNRVDQDDEEKDVERRDFISLSAGAGLAVIQPSSLLRPGRRLAADVPRHLAQRTARLRRLDDFMGGGDTYRLYMGELAETTRLVGEGGRLHGRGGAAATRDHRGTGAACRVGGV